jgi:hypothetical protein
LLDFRAISDKTGFEAMFEILRTLWEEEEANYERIRRGLRMFKGHDCK